MVGYGFHPPWIEGCSVIARNLALALHSRVNVSMISLMRLDYTTFSKENSERHFNKIYIDPIGLFKSFHRRGKYFKYALIFDVPRVLSALKSLDYKLGLDVVHVHNVSHLVMSALVKSCLNKKTVVHIFNIPGIGDLVSNSFVDRYICTSRRSCDHLTEKGIPKRKVCLIPPIIDCKIYRPLPTKKCKEVLGISQDSFLITYIGNLFPQRFPIETLAEVKKISRRHPDVKLAIYAPSSIQNRRIAIRLDKLLTNSRINHHVMVLNLSETDKVMVYNASNVIIFPFLKEIPGIIAVDPPLTILEAMACEKIVLASRTLSVSDIVQDQENGFLMEPGDFQAFRTKLEYVLNKYDKLKHVGVNARKTICRGFTSKVADTVLDVYQSILGTRKHL